jgi:hypothetical protein
MRNLPAPPVPVTQQPGRAVGIAAIVSGVIGILILPIVFGPLALILGIVAVSQGYRAAWSGVILGGVEVVYIGAILMELSNSLSNIGT